MSNTLQIYRKTAITLTFQLLADGTPPNITGDTVLFTIKRIKGGLSDDSDALVTKTATVTDGATATCTVALTADDLDIASGTYRYDVKRLDDGVPIGYPANYVTVNQTVTQRAS